MSRTVSFATIFGALGAGLPYLLMQFLATIVLLVIGIAVCTKVTRYNEREMVRSNNTAGGIVYAGNIIALAIPLASLLATSGTVLDIVVWGLVALAIQLVTLAVVALLLGHLKTMIEDGNIAAGLTIAAMQIAVALLNAAAMVPT